MTLRSPAADPHVLVVEDEPRMRDVLLRALEGWGFSASAARTGEEALRMMHFEPRAIVILDLNLPGMDGMECFEQIRQRWPQTQVIILTGFGDLEAARKAIHLDVVEFLTKPCHLGELETALSRARKRLSEILPEAPEPFEEEDEQQPPEPPPPAGPSATLEEIERQHILATLARNRGNRAATAAELGISLRTLYYRLSEYEKQGFRID